MPAAKRTRKRPYRAHEFGQALGTILATLGDSGHVKVLMPDGLSMYRVVRLLSTIEDDVIVQLEATPCWRKRAAEAVQAATPEPLWRSLDVTIYSTHPDMQHPCLTGRTVLVTDGTEVDVAKYSRVVSRWYMKHDAADCIELRYKPTHWAPLPKLPDGAQ